MEYFLKDPISFAVAVSIIMISFAISLCLFIKFIGNPFGFILKAFERWGPIAIKEIKGEAGGAGIVNIIIVICIFFLAFIVCFTPNLKAFVGIENNVSTLLFVLIIFFGAAFVFLISLNIVFEEGRYRSLYHKEIKKK